jgi:hypothetical protein
VNGVVGQQPGHARVVAHLPLVVTNKANLRDFTYVFRERQSLTQSPLGDDRLTGSDIRAGLFAVCFPIHEDVGTRVK